MHVGSAPATVDYLTQSTSQHASPGLQAPLLNGARDHVVEVIEDEECDPGPPRKKAVRRRSSAANLLEDQYKQVIILRRDTRMSLEGGAEEPYDEATLRTEMEVSMHDAVQGAVQERLLVQAVQDAVQTAVQEAVTQALSFDLRANFFTLIAITGVVLYWRGVWTLWDKLLGFGMYSEVACILTGLVIMVTMRVAGVPLVESLPSG